DAMHDAELLKRVVTTWTYRHGGASVFGPELRPWIHRAIQAPPDRDETLQARLIGAAAIVEISDDPDRAWELLAAAKEMAAAAVDKRASLDVAIAELNVFAMRAFPDGTWAQEAQLITDNIEDLARKARDAAALADARSFRVEVALRTGDVPAAEHALSI